MALGDLWVLLGSLWRYDAYMWGLGGTVFDFVLARYHILEGQEGPEDASRTSNGASQSDFGVTVGMFGVSFYSSGSF